MVKVYGTMQCPDCVTMKEIFDEKGIEYKFFNIDDIRVLKRFLKLRDSEDAFDAARKEGQIGIPCIIREDKTVTLDYKAFAEEN